MPRSTSITIGNTRHFIKDKTKRTHCGLEISRGVPTKLKIKNLKKCKVCESKWAQVIMDIFDELNDNKKHKC